MLGSDQGSEEQHAEHLMPPEMPPLEWSTDEEATEHYSGESDPGEFCWVNPFECGGYNSDTYSSIQSYSHQFTSSVYDTFKFYDTFPNYDSES